LPAVCVLPAVATRILVKNSRICLGIQTGTIAGQVAIEVERLKEKMQQLNDEIAKNGALPPDGRLREEFDLGDDHIKKLKEEFKKEDDEPEPAVELPAPPAYDDIPPPCSWSSTDQNYATQQWLRRDRDGCGLSSPDGTLRLGCIRRTGTHEMTTAVLFEKASSTRISFIKRRFCNRFLDEEPRRRVYLHLGRDCCWP
jgi:hypothetical protein